MIESPAGSLMLMFRFGVSSDREAWANRMERLCAVVETQFPGERIDSATNYNTGKPGSVTDRPAYLKKRKRNATLWIAISNDKPILRHVPADGDAWSENPGYLSVLCRVDMHQRERCDVTVVVPPCSPERCEELLVKFGDALDAYEGNVSPGAAWNLIRASCFPNQWVEAESYKDRWLPVPGKRGRVYGGYAHPCQPESIGWINYWSQETCALLGFPDLRQDASLLKMSYRTPLGAWLVKLTPSALDFADDEHRAAFTAAAHRFDKVGVAIARKDSQA